MTPKSPYFGKIETQRSMIAYLDILGFKREMQAAYANGRPNDLLRRLHDALKRACKPLEESNHAVGPRVLYSIKRFTDNIVIGYPIRNYYPTAHEEMDAEFELGTMFMNLPYFQLSLILEGFFVRGAIACGEVYMDEGIVFGDALLEAHETEELKARDPRIVIAESARRYVNNHLTFYGEKRWAPQSQMLLADADGQLFLNYLSVLDEDDYCFDFETLRKHAAVVSAKLDEFRSSPSIWSKYAWVAHYHNYYCDHALTNADDDMIVDYKVDPSLLSIRMSSI